jgi:hypothetical protein
MHSNGKDKEFTPGTAAARGIRRDTEIRRALEKKIWGWFKSTGMGVSSSGFESWGILANSTALYIQLPQARTASSTDHAWRELRSAASAMTTLEDAD